MSDLADRALTRARALDPGVGLDARVLWRRSRHERGLVPCPRLDLVPRAFHCAHFNEACPDPEACQDPCPACGGSGRLPLRDCLPLAAYAGCEASRLLVDKPWCESEPPCPESERPDCWRSHDPEARPGGSRGEGLREWSLRLDLWPQAKLRAAVAAARLAWEAGYRCGCEDAIRGVGCPTCLDTGFAGGLDELRAIEVAEDCLFDPSARGAARATYLGWPHEISPFGSVCGVACGLVGHVQHVLAWFASMLGPEGEERVRAAASGELVPWARGERDPVAERFG